MHDPSSKIAPEPEFQGSAAISLQTAADAVYAALRERIIAGQLTPGSRLTEASLCARFGLSTTPVREALQRLVHRGLGIRYTARGVSVRRLTSAVIRDIYELRCLLEPLALQQSVPNLTARHLAGIREVLSTAQSALARMDYLRLSALNDTFHTEILAGSRPRCCCRAMCRLRTA
jgi:DNA-binding GntR family transcriptional regulator